MKKLIITISLAVVATTASAQRLWYRQAANDWMQTMPIGNGRIGAQVWGQTEHETLSINESSMWSGYYNPNQAKMFGKEKLAEVRKLFFEGKIAQANGVCFEYLQGNEEGFGTHLPLGELCIAHHYPYGHGKAEGYQRELQLKDAVATVTYSMKGVDYKNTYLSSNPDDVVAVNYKASKPNAISFDISTQLLRKQTTVRTEGETLIIEGVCRKDNEHKGGVEFCARVSVKQSGGRVQATYGMLSVEGADEATLIVDLRTSYKNPDYQKLCQSTVAKALQQDFSVVEETHKKDFSRLFSRVELSLGNDDNDSIPTDERWQNVRSGNDDTALQALFFQYGRYLTASLSRENSPLPIALQGFFNDNRACSMSWNNDYHLDINTQQNYWLANVGNLAECNAPLYTYLASLAEAGHEVVKTLYGIDRGWTAYTTANVWGYTAPSGGLWWGLHVTGGSWLLTHLWEDYTFTHDREMLRRAYPIIKGNAEFLIDYMVRDPRNGYLVTGPSISPENSYGCKEGNWPATMMPTVDRVMVWEIFNACVQSAKILGVDATFARQLSVAMKRLPPYRKNKYGGLREWLDDFDDINVNHRHTSHLHGFYPYSQITLQKTPELAKAVEKSLDRRMSAKDWEDTEWSRANAICYEARLHNAEAAYNSINVLIGKLGRENLLTVSPVGVAGAPFDIFSFDGNPAGAAGMAELLVQSHEGYVEFLPALPAKWDKGYYSGICVRGGSEASAQWRDGKATMVSLKAKRGGTFRVKAPAGMRTVTLDGKKIKAKVDVKGVITVSMDEGDVLELTR